MKDHYLETSSLLAQLDLEIKCGDVVEATKETIIDIMEVIKELDKRIEKLENPKFEFYAGDTYVDMPCDRCGRTSIGTKLVVRLLDSVPLCMDCSNDLPK